MVRLNMDGPARDRVMRLMQEKDSIENKLRSENAVLAECNIGMDEPLVDADGFPRNDIDVYKVRRARHEIICLRNDLKNIMKQIEQGLIEVHSEFRPTSDGASSSGQSSSQRTRPSSSHSASNSQDSDNEVTFAKIGNVQEDSPADLGGLCENDEIIQFGSINASNFTDIHQLHNVLKHSIGQQLKVRVKRKGKVENFIVVPRSWGKPGILGCKIDKLDP